MSVRIEKRKEVTDEIFDELKKKYPVKSEKGVCYAQDTDYFNLETEIFNNSNFRRLIKDNSKVLVVYCFLRERMCHNGWYIVWDNNTKEDVVERLTLWGVRLDDSPRIIKDLIDNDLIKTFHHEEVPYLTDVQQIYNWEILQAKRARDRRSKQEKKASNKSDDEAPQEDYDLVPPPQEDYIAPSQVYDPVPPPPPQEFDDYDLSNELPFA